MLSRGITLSDIIEENTGMVWDGDEVIEECYDALGCVIFEDDDEGEMWITGVDNVDWLCRYYVRYKIDYNAETTVYTTGFKILEMDITDRQHNKHWQFDVEEGGEWGA